MAKLCKLFHSSDMEPEKRMNLMGEGNIPRVITQMAIPTIFAGLITSIYSLADTYFVSSLGTNATAAVGVNSSLDQLITTAGSMLAMGAGSYIARLLGMQEKHKASQVLSTAIFTSFAFGLILLALGMPFMTPLVRLLGATDTCEQYCIQYATFVLLAAPFMTCNYVINQCLRSEGSATLSMLGMVIGAILNVILDPIFIFKMNMGVAGASAATAISKLVTFGILFFPYMTKRSLLRLSIRNLCFSKDIVSTVVSIGSSTMFRHGLAVVSSVLLNNIAGRYSDSVLAGIGVCNKIMMFPFGIIIGFANGFQPVAGFNWGAKKYDRVQESYHFASGVAILGGAIMGILLGVFADQIILTFAGTDPEMRRIGALSIRLQCLAMPVHAWVGIVNMFCVGLGDARGASVLAVSRQGICLLPILYPLDRLLPINGVVCAQAVADMLSMAFAIPIVISLQRKIRSVITSR